MPIEVSKCIVTGFLPFRSIIPSAIVKVKEKEVLRNENIFLKVQPTNVRLRILSMV